MNRMNSNKVGIQATSQSAHARWRAPDCNGCGGDEANYRKYLRFVG